jgi:DNA-binding beta-propeller fold protein YncE
MSEESKSSVSVVKVAGADKAGFQDGAADKAQFNSPYGIAATKDGNIVITDRTGHRIRLFDVKNDTVKTLAGCGEAGFADGPGDKAKFNKPYSVLVDPDGNIFVSDTENQRIRRVDGKTNEVTTLAGNGRMGFQDGPASKCTFYRPSGMAYRDGKLYVADAINSKIRCVDIKSAMVTTVAGSGRAGFKDAAANEAEFNHPSGLSWDATGCLLVSDQGNNRVRRFDLKTSTVTSIAGSGEQKTVDGTGDKACFHFPALILCDGNSSTCLIGEWGKPCALRSVDLKTGAVTTVKGVSELRGLCLDAQGKLFAAADSHIVRIDGLLQKPN